MGQAALDNGLWADLVTAAAGDPMGPDFSGIRAHATIELHMKECAERQAELRSQLLAIHGRLDSMQQSFDERMRGLEKVTETRIGLIHNRLWAAAIGLIVGLAGLVAYFYHAAQRIH